MIEKIFAWLGATEAETMRAIIGREITCVGEAEIAARIDEIEVLLAGVAPRGVDWSRASRLRFVQVLGSGCESFFALEGLPERVVLANARGLHVPEMRDHALAMILAFERDLFRFTKDQLRRVWCEARTSSVAGTTVCVLGLGEVGRCVHDACIALGMRGTHARASEPYDLHALLASADYVVVTLPLTAKTKKLIDARALAAMKRSAVIVAMSRGGIVDESALASALRSGALRGAALDVFEEEPLPASSPLWDTPNLVITPHVAGWSADYVERLARLARENIALVENDSPPRTLVPRARGY